MSKDLFLKMSEEFYLSFPQEIRSKLAGKVYSQSDDDFNELMQYEDFKKAYDKKKKSVSELEEVKYKIREQRRNDNKENK